MEVWISYVSVKYVRLWRDIIHEGTIEGQHTRIVQDGSYGNDIIYCFKLCSFCIFLGIFSF